MLYEFSSFKEDPNLKLNLLSTVLNIYVEEYAARLVLISFGFGVKEHQVRPSLESLV